MDVSRLFKQPEYLHVVLNHFPLVGLVVSVLALCAALAARSRAATLIGLALVAATALSAWPVSASGEAGFDRVLSMADDDGQAFLRYHQQLAERWVFLYYITAGVAALGFVLSFKWPRVLTLLSFITVLLALGSLCAGLFIARAGGEVRHREFRSGPPPQVPVNY